MSANRYLKQMFEAKLLTEHPNVTSYFPAPGLSTDNSIMIALTGHARASGALLPTSTEVIRANGNRSLS